MATFFPKTITLIQRTGTFTNGVWSITTCDTTFRGSVQPVTGKDLEAVEAGTEDKGKVKIYSNTALNVKKEGKNSAGDIVVWKNQYWEVIQEMINQNDLINHYKYIAEYRGDEDAE